MREEIYSALFERVVSGYDWKFKKRGLLDIEEVDYENMPALFMVRQDEVYTPITNVGAKFVAHVDFYLYVYSSADNLMALVDNILDQIDINLKPETPTKLNCTLGGLVDYVRISGAVKVDQGFLKQDVAVVLIPMELCTTV
jgi:hypothetical protein